MKDMADLKAKLKDQNQRLLQVTQDKAKVSNSIVQNPLFLARALHCVHLRDWDFYAQQLFIFLQLDAKNRARQSEVDKGNEDQLTEYDIKKQEKEKSVEELRGKLSDLKIKEEETKGNMAIYTYMNLREHCEIPLK